MSHFPSNDLGEFQGTLMFSTLFTIKRDPTRFLSLLNDLGKFKGYHDVTLSPVQLKGTSQGRSHYQMA